MKKLGYLIITYNGSKSIEKLIDSILHKEDILVVDNASQDETCKIVQSLDVFLIKNRENKGYAAAINQGMERLKKEFEWVLILNQDTVCKDMREIHTYLEKYKNHSIIQPTILLPNGKINVRELKMNVLGFVYSKDYGKPVEKMKNKEIFFFSGAAFFMNAKNYEIIGKFDESFFLYYEDIDYAFKAHLKNQKILFLPHLQIEHAHKNRFLEKQKRKLLQKNRKIIIRRYFPKKLWFWLGVNNTGEIKSQYAKSLFKTLTPQLSHGFFTNQIPFFIRHIINFFLMPYACFLKNKMKRYVEKD